MSVADAKQVLIKSTALDSDREVKPSCTIIFNNDWTINDIEKYVCVWCQINKIHINESLIKYLGGHNKRGLVEFSRLSRKGVINLKPEPPEPYPTFS